MAGVGIRVGDAEDGALVGRCVYLALAWDPDRALPDQPTVLAHPEVARYHVGWGRHGDVVVVAGSPDEPTGYAFARLFTADDHGHGFVDEATPELGVAVEPGHRGQGIGSALLHEIHRQLIREERRAVSLSVQHGNPAKRLYERLGYRDHATDDGATVMLKLL